MPIGCSARGAAMAERLPARRAGAPLAWVLLDRDDTIIADRPHLDDPSGIEFLPVDDGGDLKEF